MRKKIGYIFIGLLLIGAILGLMTYNAIWSDNVNDASVKSQTLDIPAGSDFDAVVDIMTRENILKNVTTFKQVAKLMKYDRSKVPSGRYKIDRDWNNRQLISTLRAGRQEPITVTFNNHRTLVETLGDIASYLEVDSTTLVNHVTASETLAKYGYSPETMLTMFIPNTYEMYWNYSPDKLLERMKSEHKAFWAANNRLAKAAALGLTDAEVYTLASIVEMESQAAKERPIIAGLYLNRLERGIPLQADPTVVYAVGDFSIRRVLNKHLAHDNPYNTYKYGGLPPGPIYLPSIQSIDAVLNPADHDYIFMCAKPGYNSEHAFAKTSAEHSRNANKYRSWLTSEGIRK